MSNNIKNEQSSSQTVDNQQGITGISTASGVTTPVADNQALQAELAMIQIQKERLMLKKLELEAKAAEAQLEDLKERLDERTLKRENLQSKSIENGKTLAQNAALKVRVQSSCNHRKGGNGLAGYVGGRGNDLNYAIIRHTMCNGDTWVRCQRCGKTWKPPVESKYTDREQFYKDSAAYQVAMDWPTTNQPSSAAPFRFSDNGMNYRERMHYVTL